MSGENWQILLYDVEKNGRLDKQAFNDGANTFTIEYQPSPDDESRAFGAALRILPYPWPHDRRTQIMRIWLAFASGDYLSKSEEIGKIKHFWMPDSILSQFTNHLTLASWETQMVGEMEIPWIIKYFSDGKIYGQRDGKSPVGSYDAPYNNGFMNAQFRVTSELNIEGIGKFPERFELVRYFAKSEGNSSNDLSVLSTTLGKVHDVKFESQSWSTSLPKILPKRTVVVDHREFIPGTFDPVRYIATNGVLLRGDAVADSPEFKSRVIELEEEDRQKRGGRMALIAVVFVGILTVFGILSVYGIGSTAGRRKETK